MEEIECVLIQLKSNIQTNMKVLIIAAAIVAVCSARPRYLVVEIDDGELIPQGLPRFYMPGLTRQARQLEEYSPPQQIKRQAALEEYGSPPAYEEPSPASSNTYAAPHAEAGPDHVDYGAYTGGAGAFGWYTDHPVLLGAGHR
ncbi:uncharacterized protein LOC111709260 [Eurytemora carolleeae]|uniref:uncharacterized protein LOC111709260 n=1 Tax=Eurytemora carolleeae TaxID=1294199 RepID=UPI000C77A054|nr:uncharacterized protein LOC111709260 [Eurytemora carolleeae]|eukprot:XP_023338653.1 uncharacterized protein LOC111709260 [Eurytemora affinis]